MNKEAKHIILDLTLLFLPRPEYNDSFKSVMKLMYIYNILKQELAEILKQHHKHKVVIFLIR
jgi:hypothetical protein